MTERLIVTAASEEYARSLCALLGSLNVNWPAHPGVLVYDIGLSERTRDTLAAHHIELKRVPPFCEHWRRHYTWKIWCVNDAPARDVIWMDAGLVILKPIDEIFSALDKHGYFFVPNYQLLDWEASLEACEGCGVDPAFRLGKLTLAGGFMGLRKEGTALRVLEDALHVALVEKYIAATDPRHRHDQAIISLLAYKHFGDVVLSDGLVYAGWKTPRQTPGQKVWVHRRTLARKDAERFIAHLTEKGPPHFPSAQPQWPRWPFRMRRD